MEDLKTKDRSVVDSFNSLDSFCDQIKDFLMRSRFTRQSNRRMDMYWYHASSTLNSFWCTSTICHIANIMQ
jgi:hypothetical protein